MLGSVLKELFAPEGMWKEQGDGKPRIRVGGAFPLGLALCPAHPSILCPSRRRWASPVLPNLTSFLTDGEQTVPKHSPL